MNQRKQFNFICMGASHRQESLSDSEATEASVPYWGKEMQGVGVGTWDFRGKEANSQEEEQVSVC